MPAKLVVRPVTPSRWEDFARLFESTGAPHYCWCAPLRFAKAQDMTKEQKRAGMERLVKKGTPIGLLAYRDGEPVGWCSVAPRPTFVKLARSTVMPVVDERAWTVTCFFVARSERGAGVTKALLKAALAYARKRGATAIEGHPWDTAGVTSRHHGHSSVFEAAGFEREAKTRRWVRRFRRATRSAGTEKPKVRS